MLAHQHRSAVCGVLLCPTEPFANLLCELGRQRAIASKTRNSKRPPSYSGMMTYEKAAKELPYISSVIPGSVMIGGMNFGSINSDITAS